MKLSYRPDIDGLRAIAVLAVVLNHAGFRLFPGGFIGVDVFFVISGYLITTVILNEINENKFSISKFYERRIRRIFPALFVVLAFTLLISAVLYDANSFAGIGKSITATTLFYSNFLFWDEAGYFDSPSQLKPLLHTWSLAVEEQYYIIFPLLLWFLNRTFKNKTSYILISLTVFSLGLSIYGVYTNPSDAFYLPHMRAWELLIGSILSIGLIPVSKSVGIRNILSAVGLALIILPIFIYSEETLFPGWSALAPTLGTALIIYSGSISGAFVNRLLGLRPIVFIGLISYSLYLWHWPILVFAKYYAIKELTLTQTYLLMLIIFAVTVLSWHFIEKPFRSKPVILGGKKLFAYAAIIMTVFIASGVFINLKEGFPQNTSTALSKNPNRWQGWGGCKKQNSKYSIEVCNFGEKQKTPSFLLVGDSFAPAVGYGIHLSAKKSGVAGQIIYNLRCPPLLGIRRNKVPKCFNKNQNTMKYIEDHPEIHTVILIGRWAVSTEGALHSNSETEETQTLSDGWSKISGSNNLDLFSAGLNRTVEKLISLNRKVVIISQIPEIGYDVPSAYSIAMRTGRDINKIIAPSLEQYLSRSGRVRNAIERIAQSHNVTVIDPSKTLCDDKTCYVERNGNPLYKDATHLSIYESEYLSYLFDPIFENMSK